MQIVMSYCRQEDRLHLTVDPYDEKTDKILKAVQEFYTEAKAGGASCHIISLEHRPYHPLQTND